MRRIDQLSDYYALSVSELAHTILTCPECGRDHSIPIKTVISGANLVGRLPDVINKVVPGDNQHIGIVYDREIEEKINSLFFTGFERLGYEYSRIPLGEAGLLLEATTALGDQAALDLPNNINLLIGVGSGVVSDLTKWVATQRHLPFLIMGTAASMNAYTSITGTMTESKVKSTRWLDPAEAVLLDAVFLASAPQEMTGAGIGDLLARHIANADWKLSQLIHGTYFCPVPHRMMAPFQAAYIPLIDEIRVNNLIALQKLGDAILVSGYTMTILNGETSPSSGSEHVLSHFFDFQHEIFGKPKNLHGIQVGIGTILMSTAYEVLHEINPSRLDVDQIERHRLSETAILLDNQREFGAYSKSINKVFTQKRVPEEEFRPYITKIIEEWDRIWDEIQPFLMPFGEVRRILDTAGGKTTLSGIQRTPEDALQALLYGSRYRQRFTVLDLFWDLGLFPQVTQEILDRSGVIDKTNQ